MLVVNIITYEINLYKGNTSGTKCSYFQKYKKDMQNIHNTEK